MAGEYPTAAQMNAEVKDSVNFLANPPACRVYHSIGQTVNNASATALAFNSERYDTFGMHDTVTNNSRITFVTGGLYAVGGNVEVPAGTGDRSLEILLNGGTYVAMMRLAAAAGIPWVGQVLATYKFAAGDYIQLRLYQASGAAVTVPASTGYHAEFWATWRGKG